MPSGEEGVNSGGGGSSPMKDGKEQPATGRKHHRQNGHQKPFVPPRQPKFEGKCDGLKGHIYDCSDARQSDLYTKTTKEIAEYVGRTFTHYGGDVRLAVENLEVPTFVEPTDPPVEATLTQREIWKKMCA